VTTRAVGHRIGFGAARHGFVGFPMNPFLRNTASISASE
jgi:hypothetical protein